MLLVLTHHRFFRQYRVYVIGVAKGIQGRSRAMTLLETKRKTVKFLGILGSPLKSRYRYQIITYRIRVQIIEHTGKEHHFNKWRSDFCLVCLAPCISSLMKCSKGKAPTPLPIAEVIIDARGLR